MQLRALRGGVSITGVDDGRALLINGVCDLKVLQVLNWNSSLTLLSFSRLTSSHLVGPIGLFFAFLLLFAGRSSDASEDDTMLTSLSLSRRCFFLFFLGSGSAAAQAALDLLARASSIAVSILLRRSSSAPTMTYRRGRLFLLSCRQ